MKTLILFYSNFGNNKKIAEQLQKDLNCDIEQLTDKFQNYSFKKLLFWGGMYSVFNLDTKLKPIKKTIEDYSQVILIGPLWAGKLCTAERDFLKKNRSKIKNLALVCVCGGGEKYTNNLLKNAIKYYGKSPRNYMVIGLNEINNNSYSAKYDEFLKKTT